MPVRTAALMAALREPHLACRAASHLRHQSLGQLAGRDEVVAILGSTQSLHSSALLLGESGKRLVGPGQYGGTALNQPAGRPDHRQPAMILLVSSPSSAIIGSRSS